MLNQLQMTTDGRVLDKVEIAIKRLKAFEPPDGYYVAFSGGKDSQCVYHLCQMAGVKFDAHYAVTSVDPPELVRFIKEHYPDVVFERQHYPDGKPVTMWSLIAEHTLPPTRKVRYCCASLKEPGGAGRIVVTGVRWAESANRASTHGVVGFQGKPKNTRKIADEAGAEYKLNKHGEVIMNDDNDANRRTVEQCYRTRKTMVNPIVDWDDEDVWEFLNGNNIPHCCLYDAGFKRLGCIGCPLSGQKNMLRDFERWPKYKELYIRAFQHMIDNHPGQIKILDPNAETKFKLEIDGGGWTGFGTGSNGPMGSKPPTDIGTEFTGGAADLLPNNSRSNAMVSQRIISPGGHTEYGNSSSRTAISGGGTNWERQCSTDGSRRLSAEWLFDDWRKNGGNWSTNVRTRIGNGSFHALDRTWRKLKGGK